MARGEQVDMLLSGLCDSSGNPLASGKVYTYVAGTTTPASVYTDHTLVTAAANPVVLDSTGKALVFASGAFKFVIKTAADATLYTHDNLLFFAPDSGYTTFNPTMTCSGSMTITSQSVTTAQYAMIGPKSVHLIVSVTGTLGGTASPTVYCPLPVAPSTSLSQFAPYFYGEAGAVVATIGTVGFSGSNSRAEFHHASVSVNFALGVWGAILNCVYRTD